MLCQLIFIVFASLAFAQGKCKGMRALKIGCGSWSPYILSTKRHILTFTLWH